MCGRHRVALVGGLVEQKVTAHTHGAYLLILVLNETSASQEVCAREIFEMIGAQSGSEETYSPVQKMPCILFFKKKFQSFVRAFANGFSQFQRPHIFSETGSI